MFSNEFSSRTRATYSQIDLPAVVLNPPPAYDMMRQDRRASPIEMNLEQHQNFAEDFRVALEEFHEVRKQHTRTSFRGEEFVLVDKVTEQLKSRSPSCSAEDYKHDLDRLGQAAYLQYDPRPPKVRRKQYEKHLPVFYTLLDIGAPTLIDQFRTNKDLESLPISLSVLKKSIRAPRGFSNFHEKFFSRQFMWCPIRFEMEMGQKYDHDMISPFARKEQIKPYREGRGPLVNTATLYAIDVPEELVGPKLQKRMASARIERQDEEDLKRGWKYSFAMKQFMDEKHDHFENEMEMFQNLVNKDGMIQYIGWFRSFEPNGRGGKTMFWNIVLELAEFDFYTAIRSESPPISINEISGFWQTMSEISAALASIHTVEIDQHNYLFWHGDIKPENILRVDARFKLADPGEASMLLEHSNVPGGQQKAKAMGGTRTYAAPEKAAYLDGTSMQEPNVTQTSDVWSLGCVLSIAATYVVLGKQGVLIYTHLRIRAIFNATENKSDAFHNGDDVLKEVTQWHKYLRETARRTDPYSARVLDMIDKHMLVSGDERWSAKEVSEEFESIFADVPAPKSKVPRELEQLLEGIDLQVETSYDHNSGIKRTESEEMTKRLVSVPDLPEDDVEFESRNQLLAEKILPVAQRSRIRALSVSKQFEQAVRLDLVVDGAMRTRQVQMMEASNDGRQPPTPTTPPDVKGKRRTSTFLQPTTSPDTYSPREPMTVFRVRDELEKQAMGWRPSLRSFGSLVGKQPTTLKGKNEQGLKTDTLESRLDSRLRLEFKDRDIVFLVDNGSTMTKHWKQAKDLLEVLVWRSLGYDENGVELRFSDPDTNSKAKIKESRRQTVKQFSKAMDLAAPSNPKSPPVKTNILPPLEHIINTYTRAKTSARTKPRKRTIIVLTDGLWEGMNIEYTLDVYLKSAFQVLRDLHGDLPYIQEGHFGDRVDISVIRPVTIQFIRFGNDSAAKERLRRLDDDMKSSWCPDLIDTEHAFGDIYKMFLGSVCDDIDDDTTDITGPPLSQATSYQSSTGGNVVRGSVLGDASATSEVATPSRTLSQTAHQRSTLPSPPPSATRHELSAGSDGTILHSPQSMQSPPFSTSPPSPRTQSPRSPSPIPPFQFYATP